MSDGWTMDECQFCGIALRAIGPPTMEHEGRGVHIACFEADARSKEDERERQRQQSNVITPWDLFAAALIFSGRSTESALLSADILMEERAKRRP